MTTEQPTTEGLRELLGGLIDGWKQDRNVGHFLSKAPPAKVATVAALAAHAHRLASAALTLLDAGFTVEAVPTIRSAYEAALTASWVAQVPDALPAYLNRNHAQQKSLRAEMVKARWIGEDEAGIPADLEAPYVVSKPSKKGAERVMSLCDDFRGSASLYSIYRGLSWTTHPTAAVTDLYLEMREGADVPILRTSAHQSASDYRLMNSWLHVLCCSLVWSARALNFLDSNRASTDDRRRLREAAARLDVVDFLHITPEAKFRGEQAERIRARSSGAD